MSLSPTFPFFKEEINPTRQQTTSDETFKGTNMREQKSSVKEKGVRLTRAKDRRVLCQGFEKESRQETRKRMMSSHFALLFLFSFSDDSESFEEHIWRDFF
jgi:hypothetical protein